MKFTSVLLGFAATAFASPIAKRGVFSQSTYNDLSISGGSAGNAQQEALQKLGGLPTDLSTVEKSDLDFLDSVNGIANDAEKDAFNPAIEAASGEDADALQRGKIKNKVLKLTATVLKLEAQQAQGEDVADNMLESDQSWPLWDNDSLDGAFDINDNAVVTKVNRPCLFGYRPTKPNGRGILVIGGGGYVELMVGREGVAVAKWLNSLGFYAFVLVHRFPNSETGPQAPLDDGRRALKIMAESGLAPGGISICGLSSGGHLGAALLAKYPQVWTSPDPKVPQIEFAILGYGPISTNAVGRTIIENKPPLPPQEKQEFYNVVQPDVQLRSPAPPAFIVYSNNDPVVPVVNAYRLAEGFTKNGASVELHVFADAPHGFALDSHKDLPVTKWPSMCEAWLRQHKWIE
ncbi:hypothetical protein KAF25_003619 [Fusarium avenaceum]|uniref:Dienelactone hydrolase domain-containing protein n=1 Tax=Fusarium avenaceum TaxID=40199 RepID=A0A9P7H810_9HYPO|nr:hypothetical protein KAF25_003619 [Fusarium avenaceum]